MPRIVYIVLPWLVVAGCAAGPDKPVADAKQTYCTREARTGSNIPVVTCDEPQTSQQRQRTIDTINNSIHPIPRSAGPGG